MGKLGGGKAEGIGDRVFPLENLVIEVFHVLFDIGDILDAGRATPDFRGKAGVGDGKGEVGGRVILRRLVSPCTAKEK